MYRPNRTCTIQKRGGHDQYGQETVGASFTEPCAVVQMRHVSTPTTVRADSSASRGHGEEFITYNTFLLGPKTQAVLNDKVTISGLVLRIIDIHPRYNIAGGLDHYEVQGKVWS